MRKGSETGHVHESFWTVFPAIAIIGTITWLAVFEHNYHPRIYRYAKDVTILQVGDSELDFNHPPGAFSVWWQTGRSNVSDWPRDSVFSGAPGEGEVKRTETHAGGYTLSLCAPTSE